MIDTTFIAKCLNTLKHAVSKMQNEEKNSIEYDIYRTAAVKEFEIILEQAGTLLKRALRNYYYSSKKVDMLYFKDIFRHAANHSIITIQEAENWIKYRDERNDTVHHYGEEHAEDISDLMNKFIKDTNSLIQKLNKIQ